MAEEIKEQKKEHKKEQKKELKKEPKKEEKGEKITSITRILSTDIPGNKKVGYGLTRIKGVSFSFANAICTSLNISPEKRVSDLSEKEIADISQFILNPKLPAFMLNRRKDIETGQDKHLISTNLELQKDSDIKMMRKMKSYKGWRHALGLPVRGQRTRSHFRHGKSVGVMKTKQKPASGTKEK